VGRGGRAQTYSVIYNVQYSSTSIFPTSSRVMWCRACRLLEPLTSRLWQRLTYNTTSSLLCSPQCHHLTNCRTTLTGGVELKRNIATLVLMAPLETPTWAFFIGLAFWDILARNSLPPASWNFVKRYGGRFVVSPNSPKRLWFCVVFKVGHLDDNMRNWSIGK